MPLKKNHYYITKGAQERFRRYLFNEHLSFAAFCKRAGVCRQYLDRAVKGKIPITPKVREAFRKGGYDLL